MTPEAQQLCGLFDNRRQQIFADFFNFLRFKSISSEPAYKSEILACSSWLQSYLNESGFQTQTWDTTGHPIVFGTWLHAGRDKPTVLIYGHYDVQPVDPIELWNSPPFEPTIRDGEVYARGAVDNKGQCFYVMSVLKSMLEARGSLPVNVKLFLEGEEETGSPGISEILLARKNELAADHMLIVDTGFQYPDRPVVNLGYRGIVELEVEVISSSTDLHSGSHGGLVYNPNHALVNILAELRDENGKVQVPGFYDDVVAPTSDELKNVDLHLDLDRYEKEFGAKIAGGERKLAPRERVWFRPTLEVNGIGGGYTGPGFKTVIPAHASAKISARLVPNQDPKKIAEKVALFIKYHAPEGVKANVHVRPGSGKPFRTGSSSKVVQVAARAYEDVLGKACRFAYMGGTIPIVSDLAAANGADVVLMGYSLPDDRHHAPNEHFGVERFRNGFVTVGRILEDLAKV